ncbi:Apoptosis-inducing factor B [Chlorella vulgaris]
MGDTQKTVLIVGGGFAGIAAANELSGAFNVILVDPKTFFEYVPNTPHTFLSLASASRTLVDYPAGGVHKQGVVVGLTSDGTQGKATLQASSSYASTVKPGPTRVQARESRLRELYDTSLKIEAASSVLVVGGGSVGVELASLVKEAHPSKRVTLVCSGATLLDRMAPQAQRFAEQWMRQHGVEVLTGERISDWGGLGDGPPAAATLTTASGRRLEGDLVFKCVGARPATAAFAASLTADQLGPAGSIAVEPTLQVVGWRNVFAAGDCSSVDEEKTAALAGLSALAAAANILALEAGSEPQAYPESLFGGLRPPLVGGTSLGAHSAVMQLGPSSVQTGSGPALMKKVLVWLYSRVAGGSRVWGLVYRQMQRAMVLLLTREARKLAATTAAAAPAVLPATATKRASVACIAICFSSSGWVYKPYQP